MLDPAGAVLTTIPLTQGAGTGPMNDPAAAKVRILDAAGDVVGEGPRHQDRPVTEPASLTAMRQLVAEPGSAGSRTELLLATGP